MITNFRHILCYVMILLFSLKEVKSQSCFPVLDIVRKHGSTFFKVTASNQYDNVYNDGDGNTVTDTYADLLVEFFSDPGLTIPKFVNDFPCDLEQQTWVSWPPPYINYVYPNSYPLRTGTSFTKLNTLISNSITYVMGGSSFVSYNEVMYGGASYKVENCLSKEARLFMTNGNYFNVNNASWYKDNVLVSGVSTPFYNTDIAGNYHVTVPSALCGGTITTPVYNYTANFSCDPTLPLRIKYFNVIDQGNCKTKISWQLEDSYECQSLKVIAYENNAQKIVFNENSPVKSINSIIIDNKNISTVKLSLVDFVGAEFNSSIKKVKPCVNPTQISSNFSNGRLVVINHSQKQEAVVIKIINSIGQTITSINVNLSPGNNYLNVNNQFKGIHIISVLDSKGTQYSDKVII